MMRVLLAVTLSSLALFGAQGKGKGKGKGSQPQAQSGGVSVSVVFSSRDRSVLQDWVRTTPAGSLPPGLAKRGSLPPGLQKQLQRNGTLPPGLQKKIDPFPMELNRRLGPLPVDCGCDRVFLDGRAMIIARATMAILDVINLF